MVSTLNDDTDLLTFLSIAFNMSDAILARQERDREAKIHRRMIIDARRGYTEEDMEVEDKIYDRYMTNALDDAEDESATQFHTEKVKENELPILKLWTAMSDLALKNLVQAGATFHQFSNFPPEVRQKIWHFAIKDKLSDITPQVIRVRWAAVNFYDMLYSGCRVPWAQEPMKADRNIRHGLLTFFLKVCKESSEIAQLYHGIQPLFEGSELVPGKLYFKSEIDTLAIRWSCFEHRLHADIDKIAEGTIHLVESLRVYIDLSDTEPGDVLLSLFEKWKNGGEEALQHQALRRFITHHPFTSLKKLEFMFDGNKIADDSGRLTVPEYRSENFTEVMTRHFFKPAYAASTVPEVTFTTYHKGMLLRSGL